MKKKPISPQVHPAHPHAARTPLRAPPFRPVPRLHRRPQRRGQVQGAGLGGGRGVRPHGVRVAEGRQSHGSRLVNCGLVLDVFTYLQKVVCCKTKKKSFHTESLRFLSFDSLPFLLKKGSHPARPPPSPRRPLPPRGRTDLGGNRRASPRIRAAGQVRIYYF